MQIKRETTQKIFTTDNKEISVGDVVVFNCDGRCITGGFMGITKRGALQFGGLITDTEVTFNVMPGCIDEIYLADVQIDFAEKVKNVEVNE